MTTIQRSALVPYSAQAMFDLVNAIETYPQFMDGCAGATVINRANDTIEARLDLAKGGMRYSFTTRNRLMPPERIEMTLVEGPFDKFQGVWTFQVLGEHACKISLHLEFELAGRLLNFAARKMFDGVANQMVDALVKRAHKLHGSL
ncbi:MAG: type II toxin-antitoxin system RatA family toxin [Spongiibacteraceae bacterium]